MIAELAKTISEQGIAYHRVGSGQTLLLIHGVGMCAESWRPFIELASQHFDVIAIDLPGHGQSVGLNKAFDEVGLDDYLEPIEQLCRSLNITEYVVCGHSLGALIAVELTARSNDISKMFALNTIYQRSDKALKAVQQRAVSLNESDGIIGVAQTIERWFGIEPEPDMQAYADACEHWLRSNNQIGYALAYKTFADQRGPSLESLGAIRCRAIFITGELDLNSSSAMSNALAEQLPGAQSFTAKNAGHMLPLTHANELLPFFISSDSNKCANASA